MTVMRSMLHRHPLTLLFALLPLLFTRPAAAGELLEIVAHGGEFSVLDHDKGIELGFESRFQAYRFRRQPAWLPDFRPMAGIMTSGHGSLYAYAGFGIELPVGSGWILRPSWATGFFQQRRERDLGGAIEFRSAIEVSRPINRRMRLGLAFYHLSNAGLFSRNPGAESLVLSLVARP